jgi:hypothetical protein
MNLKVLIWQIQIIFEFPQISNDALAIKLSKK